MILNSVDPSEIEVCSRKLKKNFTDLQEAYDIIKINLKKYNDTLKEIENFDNTYTTPPTPIENTEATQSNYILERAKIRRIKIETDDSIEKYIGGLRNSELEESIQMLSLAPADLNRLAEDLVFYIKLIQNQLKDNEDLNKIDPLKRINKYFRTAKKDPNWEEIKENAREGMELKKNDEIYLKYHSNSDGEYDYVDFALDHLGTAFLTGAYSSIPAIWYKNAGLAHSNDVTEDNNWCAEFVSYIMFNSGNSSKIPGAYISCVTGANEAAELGTSTQTKAAVGTWHPASDENYKPQRGDIFYKSDHTGIVVASDDNYIYTIEGNTAKDDGSYYVLNATPENANRGGGVVNTRVRDRKGYVDLGFYTPDNSDLEINIDRITESTTPKFSEEYIEKKTATQELFKEHRAATGH